MLSLIIAGSRTFNDYGFFRDKCDFYLKNYLVFDIKDHKYNPKIEIISGCARGPDEMGIIYAAHKFIKVKEFKPDWDQFGKRAGILRNIEMKDYAIRNGIENAGLLCFWNYKSTGSKHMIDIAEKAGMNVRIIRI